nr:transposase, MuDR, MULE transposase domain protein [Tanacetum cinerariifolium]
MYFKPDIPETPLYNSKPMISKHYKKETNVKVGQNFDNKEALDLAIRLKALDEGYQFLNERPAPERTKKQRDSNTYKNRRKMSFRDVIHCPWCIDLYVRELSTPIGYNRCGTFKGSIQGNKSDRCRHGWKQPNCANCFWYMQRENRHAAIALAVQNEFPLAYNAVCCRRLMMNLSLKRDKTKALFWKICKAYTTEKFSSSMSHLQDIQSDAFTSPPRRSFVGGLVATVDPVELEIFSTNQVKSILNYSLGYDENSTTFIYLRKPNCSLDSGLVPLADALQDLNMLFTFTDRRVEINNMMVLHDHSLIDYGKYALGCMTGADMKKRVYLKSVRDELLRSMEEKRQLMTNYRDM